LTEQRLLDHVVGVGGTAEGFLAGGFMATLGVRALVQVVGKPMSKFRRILDFGCGPARILCWLGDVMPAANVIGVDINAEAIEWCRNNIGDAAEFVLNTPHPPLPIRDESIDLVYGLSVFTHLDEEFQFRWLEELHRITAPGAILVLTIHGEGKAKKDLWESAYAEYESKRFVYTKSLEDRGVAGLPDFYQVTYHHHDYIAERWSRYFEPLLAVKQGPFWVQDAVVLRKRRHPRLVSVPDSKYPVIQLPLVSIESPTPGKEIEGRVVEIYGWMFYPDSPAAVEPVAWIDGVRVECEFKRYARADVAAIQGVPQAMDSGFWQRIAADHLKPGTHLLVLTCSDSAIPISATYFVVK
jgi:SAM-dependent methyltransferase